MLTWIDELLRAEYPYLTTDDDCCFLREYTARKGFQHSDTNNLIINLKKPLDRRDKPEWRYKEKAIHQASAELEAAIGIDLLRIMTLVPMPPSRARGDAEYDDRMCRVLQEMGKRVDLDIRDMLTLHKSMIPSHESEGHGFRRPSVEDIRQNLEIDSKCLRPVPENIIGIFDDILTTGCHFRAAKLRLQEAFPGVAIVGFFVARVIRDEAEIAID